MGSKILAQAEGKDAYQGDSGGEDDDERFKKLNVTGPLITKEPKNDHYSLIGVVLCMRGPKAPRGVC